MLGFDRKSEASMHLEILGWALMRHQLSEPPAHNTDCTDMSMCMPNLSCVLEGCSTLQAIHSIVLPCRLSSSPKLHSICVYLAGCYSSSPKLH
eukprot:1157526-Pelagomonas_calceolata.AAC.8